MRGDEPGGPIRWRMFLPVAVQQVWGALTTDAGRAAFWAESAVEVDGCIEFHFANGYRWRGKILRSDAPSLFEVDYFGGPVTFELTECDHGVDLLMTHRGVGIGEWNEVHAGWLNVLFPLKAWVVHGVDLRNHDPARSWDAGYADQ